MIAAWNLDVLEQANGIADHGDVDILSGEVVEEPFEIGTDQFRMFPDAIAQGPRGALGDPVFSLEKEFDQHGKTRLVLTNIADDPVGLFFIVSFQEKLVYIDRHLVKFNA